MPLPTQDIELQFPLQGIVRRFSYSAQPPQSTPDALNVRPESLELLRYRGGTRPGLVRQYSQTLAGACNAMEYITWVDASASNALKHTLVVGAGGSVYQDIAGTLTAISGATLGTSFTQGVDIGQKLYFADHSGGGNVKVWDPGAATWSTLTANAGTVPTNCKIISKFRGRLILAGDSTDPHIWYMSRVGDSGDWDYAVEDDTAVAVSGALSEAFKVGEAITAIIPSSDLCLFFGCTNSLWLMRGDPAEGGRIDNLSHTVGIIDQGAWCKTPENILVFISHDGLYMSNGGCDESSRPQSLSRERLPADLLDIDPSTTLCLLEYDSFSRGIHIFLTPKSGSTAATHWYFDWENKGFWKCSLPGTMQPRSIRAARGVGSDQSTVYLGSIDGRVRKFSTEAEDDDGTAFESWLDIGPISPTSGFKHASVDGLIGVLASGSGDVYWHLRGGWSPQDAFDRSYLDSVKTRCGLWPAGDAPRRAHPRLTAADFYLRLRHPASPWTLERIGVSLTERGLARN